MRTWTARSSRSESKTCTSSASIVRDRGRRASHRLDLTSLILAEGSKPFLGIDVAYLQTGHLILVAVTLLAALVRESGLPLTDLPDVYRGFLQQARFAS